MDLLDLDFFFFDIRFFCIFCCFFYICICFFFNFMPYYLIKNLESKFHAVQDKMTDGVSHILVLGGGHTPNTEILFEQQLSNTALRRVLEGVRLANIHPNSLLIMSGQSLKLGHPSQAEIQAEVAITMGVKKEFIKIISEPYNTEKEAIFYKMNFAIHKKPIFLVTKALHLKRALFIFSKLGYNIIPSPSYFVYQNFNPHLGWFLAPDFNLILHFGEYLKEIVGYNVFRCKIAIGFKSFSSTKLDVQKN